MSDTNGPGPHPFAQAAQAAHHLLGRLESYEATLAQITGLRADAGALQGEVAAAIGPTRDLAAAATDAADAYRHLADVGPEVEQTLHDLQAAVAASLRGLTDALQGASDAATQTVEDTAAAASARVAASLAATSAALRQVEQATQALDARVSTDGMAAAETLVEALSLATEQVRHDATRTTTSLVEPAAQASAMFERAGALAAQLGSSLEQMREETRQALRQDVGAAVATLRQGLTDADAEFRANRAADMRRVLQAAWATFGAVVVFGIALLAFGRGCGSDPGLALGESTVQILNGVDHGQDYAAEVAQLVSAAGRAKATITGDAPTVRQRATYVLVHGASLEAGRELAAELGLDDWRVRPGAPVPYAGQLTILIGQDFREAIPALQ